MKVALLPQIGPAVWQKLAVFCLVLGLWSTAHAHALAPALLELEQLAPAGSGRYVVSWRKSAIQVPGSHVEPRMPTSCANESTPRTTVEDGQALLQQWEIRCAASSLAGHTIGIAGLESSPINVILRLRSLDGEVTTSLLDASQPAYAVPVPGDVPPVFRSYLQLGIEHLLLGLDHVLFVAGLFLLVRGMRRLVLTATAFTLGHSVTLALATLGVVSVNSAATELAIALSIVALAYELARPRPQSLFRRRPWLMACAFGLLHGLGFAGALAEVGLPQGEIPLALLAFNIGIELGQLAVLAALGLCAQALRRLPPRMGQLQWPGLALLPAYGIGSLAMYWCIERAVVLMA